MNKTAFIFPGQGAQKCGMGKDFYEKSSLAKAIFDTATAKNKNTIKISKVFLIDFLNILIAVAIINPVIQALTPKKAPSKIGAFLHT